MSWTTLGLKALDDGLFYQDLNEIIGNLVAVKEFPKRVLLGGDPKVEYVTTTYTLIDDAIYVEIDATNAQGAVYELHFMGLVTSGDTGWVKLVADPTGAATLIVEKSFTITTLDLIKSATFALPAAVTKFGVMVKATTGGTASPFKAYGFAVVQR